ncbi:MAG: hypothetical protein Q9227_000326 [Pyrenula ochraceoflavens]
MTRSKSSKAPELDTSWVVDDVESNSGSSSGEYPEPSFEPSIRSQPVVKGKARLARDEHDHTASRGRSSKSSGQTSSRPKTTRHTSETSPEPELIMPSIHENDTEESWVISNAAQSRQLARTPRRRTSQNAKPATPRTRKSPRLESRPLYESRNNGSGDDTYGLEKTVEIFWAILSWASDLAFSALRLLRMPLIAICAVYFLSILLQLTQGFLMNKFYSALTPFCRVPPWSLLHICEDISSSRASSVHPKAPVEFDRLMNTQSHFEEILATSSNAVSLPLDMKRSETSIRDLRSVVKFSNLAAKQELALEFDGFIETARLASFDLTRFNGHVGRAVDSVISIDRWTTRILNDIEEQSHRRSRGLLPTILFFPFRPITSMRQSTTESALLDQYIKHTSLVSVEITRLTEEAQALLYTLNNLEDRLGVIHEISIRENMATTQNREDLLAHLWTMLGGNRAQLSKFNGQLKLLREVGEYRKTAHAHVAKTALKLQAMGAELEELRERVGSAGVARDSGYEVPLSVHLESLRKGIERLEEARGKGREVEGRVVRGVLDNPSRTHLALEGEEEIRRIEASG